MRTVRVLYLILANTLILLALATLAAHLFLRVHIHFSQTSEQHFRSLSAAAKSAYAHMAPEAAEELLRNTDRLRFRYAQLVGWRERATKSRFVNVDANGIRSNGGALRPIAAIEGAIWFFGGSTTFGYGVADAETIPAELEQLIGRPVVNFGVGAFYSAQENLLLQRYLEIGYRPSAAIFLDGINERCDEEVYQEEMKMLFAKAQAEYEWDILEIFKPVTQLSRRAVGKLKRLMGYAVDPPDEFELICEGGGKRIPLREIHARILAERNAVCRAYTIECGTAIQPFAGVHGRHDDLTNLSAMERTQLRERFSHLEPTWRNSGAIFVTDAFDNHDRHAYVDDVHYSAAASRLIAQAIARKMPAIAR